ncbi:hypothetical protein EDD27_1496 [Nonomuraea polychroma]|uniref:Mobilization protein n=1 Tax=Nonomuraea polychroma TaxID=46176 RepID=A0A438M028_9ACTN|nr:hypothetical protein [Nonomuraea polychroma]RVX39149.1 hypothetical protein EDD27_1496 [Nonomuraea polychroma]
MYAAASRTGMSPGSYAAHVAVAAARQELLVLPVADRDRPLIDTTWARIATRLIDAAGIAPLGDVEACRWIALRHARDHIHLVATLARQDGRIPEMHGNWYRMRETCDRIEAELALLLTWLPRS